MENSSLWDEWVEEALSKLEALKVLRSLRPIYLSPNDRHRRVRNPGHIGEDYEVFDEMQHWDRNAVQISISDSTFQRWLHDVPSSGTLSLCLSVYVCVKILMWFSLLGSTYRQ